MRFAFVSPRYGADISSGPEHACRLLAERVGQRHEVEVLSTCARDPLTWQNEYSEGLDRVGGVLVRRFPVTERHDRIGFEQLSAALFGSPRHARTDEVEWVRRLGPVAPALAEHLGRHARGYDAVLFFSLLSTTTYSGSEIVRERSVLFPCAQVHPAMRLTIWHEVLRHTSALGFLSHAEDPVMRAYFGPALPPEEMVGIGIDLVQQQTYPRHQLDPADDPADDEGLRREDEDSADMSDAVERGLLFRRRHRLYGPLSVYTGRVDADNGSEEMLEYFDGYAAVDPTLSLVLTGVKMMKLPDADYLSGAGVLRDREQPSAYQAADITLAPAPGDVLALPVLQSFAAGAPVLASARNRTAVEYCRRGQGGLFYATREEFIEALRLLATNPGLRKRLGENGRQYVRHHHRWDAVMGRFDRLIGRIRPRA